MSLLPLFVQNELQSGQAGRMSALNFLKPFVPVLPIADGVITAADRGHLVGLYSGIPAVVSIVINGVPAALLVSGVPGSILSDSIINGLPASLLVSGVVGSVTIGFGVGPSSVITIEISLANTIIEVTH